MRSTRSTRSTYTGHAYVFARIHHAPRLGAECCIRSDSGADVFAAAEEEDNVSAQTDAPDPAYPGSG